MFIFVSLVSVCYISVDATGPVDVRLQVTVNGVAIDGLSFAHIVDFSSPGSDCICTDTWFHQAEELVLTEEQMVDIYQLVALIETGNTIGVEVAGAYAISSVRSAVY